MDQSTRQQQEREPTSEKGNGPSADREVVQHFKAEQPDQREAEEYDNDNGETPCLNVKSNVLNRASAYDFLEIFLLGLAEVGSAFDLSLGEDLSLLAGSGLLNLLLELLL